MKDYTTLTKRFTFYTIVLIIIFAILSFLPSYQSVFLGLLVGSLVSLVHLWTTYFQVKRLGEAIEEGRSKFSLGTLFRIGIALAVLYVAYQNPDIFHFTSVIIGLMITYIIIFVHSLFQLKRL